MTHPGGAFLIAMCDFDAFRQPRGPRGLPHRIPEGRPHAGTTADLRRSAYELTGCPTKRTLPQRQQASAYGLHRPIECFDLQRLVSEIEMEVPGTKAIRYDPRSCVQIITSITRNFVELAPSRCVATETTPSIIPAVVVYACDAVSFAAFKPDQYKRNALELRIKEWVGSKASNERSIVRLGLEIRRIWFRIPAIVELGELQHR